MNPYIQAIYNITHYPPGLIEDMVTLDGDKPHSHYLPGTMQHDILIIYAAIREYERLTNHKT